MAKKTKVQPIHVKNPKLGATYYFKFAGSILQGTLIEKSKSLSEYYKIAWYYMHDKEGTKYPVSIHWLAEDPKQIKYV